MDALTLDDIAERWPVSPIPESLQIRLLTGDASITGPYTVEQVRTAQANAVLQPDNHVISSLIRGSEWYLIWLQSPARCDNCGDEVDGDSWCIHWPEIRCQNHECCSCAEEDEDLWSPDYDDEDDQEDEDSPFRWVDFGLEDQPDW